ncbi:ArsR/SmtB family transcription factor [Tautonia sociabilis]|uniref:ArsR family transcriptional regulator n=1 Tax=Tautonia sociabilis TaxID=2080755 RepID=A0A432MJC0_9BACT|nr:metalloregulator ArsR/SmtB family transcription factor [Tautonia sociabilis]RUL87472.1 ArsR family transcriptional regulator [Tautonia sociabilis]
MAEKSTTATKAASKSSGVRKSAGDGKATAAARPSTNGKRSAPKRGRGPSAAVRQAAERLKQVSDPTRLQVLMLLSEKERNVSELCADLVSTSQPAVSHHLALLRHGRLIEPRRQGKHNYYYLTDAGRELAQVVDAIV